MQTAVAHAREDFREWTDKQDRRMQARYVEVRGDHVYLQRDDGRYFEFPLADLSAADQKFVQAQLDAASPEPETDGWAKFNYQHKVNTGIATHIVGRYREVGKYLEVEISFMSFDIPRSLIDSHGVRMARCYPMVIQPDNRQGRDWWRGRSIQARDSDGSLAFDPAQPIANDYTQMETPATVQKFKVYISPWTRKPQDDKLLLCMYANPHYVRDRHIDYYFPIAEIAFKPEPKQ